MGGRMPEERPRNWFDLEAELASSVECDAWGEPRVENDAYGGRYVRVGGRRYEVLDWSTNRILARDPDCVVSLQEIRLERDYDGRWKVGQGGLII
jgi:hypothetical protein